MANGKRVVGFDIGAETIKAVELVEENGERQWRRRALVEHNKTPMEALRTLLVEFDIHTADAAAVTGRMGRPVNLAKIPIKQAQATGFRFLFPDVFPATIVSIGSHGFSVLELRESELEVFRENSRCSQGTGNFLRQLVERFNLSIEDASVMCATVSDPAPLSGRCPVILKTDMTHLANKGESKERILAGLYDAVCENVQVLIKPRVSPQTVVLIGGVTRAERIRSNFQRFLSNHEMTILTTDGDDALYVEALGCAVEALADPQPIPAADELISRTAEFELDRLPPSSKYLHRIQRLKAEAPSVSGDGPIILGFDIGSTGSKVVALEVETARPIWEGYINTNGAPVRAAQTLAEKFLASEVSTRAVAAVGATGSGREIVGSLMSTCFGPETVFVLNEIAAHAEGALYFDKRVDTIFEIGGQDAKYIRLSEGRVVDAAMNEACSAGTGSFIEEQGKKFQGIKDVIHLGQEALNAEFGVSLGQHCSVFMAEIIDEAVAAEMPTQSIIAGIYDSIIQNYLNRVKGSRSVGNVIFCQGMPFSADALAAAVVRQTGSEVVIPPNPGTIGALGIALLTRKELRIDTSRPGMALTRFLTAELKKKDTFICKSKKGCGGAGNKCRIDRLTTVVDGTEQKFTWGGGCSLYDAGTGKKKLPDKSPDPFREREELMEQIRESLSASRGKKTVAMTDEFSLKTLFPFFSTFIHDLGFDPVFHHSADQSVLKRGIEDANVPFCAPMQQYHGLVSIMAEGEPDYLFLPMLRNIQRVGDESIARLCPIVQGSADMLKWDVELKPRTKIISPVINFGQDNFASKLFLESCRSLAYELGVSQGHWEKAYEHAVAVQEEFDKACLEIGDRALAFCKEQGITPVVVLGRAYTIYNTVLNSNVPYLLREQGAIAVPVDCYRVRDDIPIFQSMYWGYGQRNLRAAQQIRGEDKVYSLFCSNYSCGPDSFSIHFYSYIMAGKPFAIIETDGHSGDAGTKTRIEAFLYCVHEDLLNGEVKPASGSFKRFEKEIDHLPAIIKKGATILVPRMGAGAEALAACLRGIGADAEALPMPDRETLEFGRRHTSGKECIPLTLTMGALLQRLDKERDPNRHFSFFMPTATGPCRFGSYNTLQKIVIERLGYKDRVGFWSPIDDDYFEGVDDGFAGILFAGFVATDILLAGLYDVRPVETSPGAADEIFAYYHKELLALLERETRPDLSAGTVVGQTMSGNLFGITKLMARAARAFKEIKGDQDIPTVLVVGELYVRCDPASNDFVIRKLEQRGIRGRFAAFYEWLEYTDYQDVVKKKIPEYVSSFIQATIQHQLYLTMGNILGWPRRTSVQDSLVAASPYIRESLSGEAVLTVGGPLHEWREGHIDGTVSVGPLECMPNKIAEAQFYHVAEHEGLLSLTLSLNGDPIDPAVLDNFAFEVHARHRQGKNGSVIAHPPTIPPRPSWVPQSKVNRRDPGPAKS